MFKNHFRENKVRLRRLYEFGSESQIPAGKLCGFSTDGNIAVKTVVKVNKSQPVTLFIQACSTAANLWPRGTSAAAHLLETSVPPAWIATD